MEDPKQEEGTSAPAPYTGEDHSKEPVDGSPLPDSATGTPEGTSAPATPAPTDGNEGGAPDQGTSETPQVG